MIFRKATAAPQMGQSAPAAAQAMAQAAAQKQTASAPTPFKETLKSALTQLETMKLSLRAISCEMVVYNSPEGFHMFVHTPHEKSSTYQKMLIGLDLQGEQHNGEYVSISLIPKIGQKNGLLKPSAPQNFMPDGSNAIPGGPNLNKYIYDSVIESLGADRVAALDKASWPWHLENHPSTPKPNQMG